MVSGERRAGNARVRARDRFEPYAHVVHNAHGAPATAAAGKFRRPQPGLRAKPVRENDFGRSMPDRPKQQWISRPGRVCGQPLIENTPSISTEI
jgi:hypothetical protein